MKTKINKYLKQLIAYHQQLADGFAYAIKH